MEDKSGLLAQMLSIEYMDGSKDMFRDIIVRFVNNGIALVYASQVEAENKQFNVVPFSAIKKFTIRERNIIKT